MADKTFTEGEVPFVDADETETYAIAELDAQTRQGFAVTDIRADLTNRRASYCSMEASDLRSVAMLYNAVSNPEKIKKIIGKQIKLAHIYIDAITLHDQQSGEVITAPRVVLIDDKAQSWQSVSMGMYESVKKLIQMFGDPSDWAKPLTVEIVPVELKNGGTTYNLKAVFD